LLNTILGGLSSGVAASTSSYESIASATGTGSSATITFSAIPSTYASLQVRWLAKRTNTSTGATELRIQFNSDTGTNYVWHDLSGDGSTAIAQATTGLTYGYSYAAVAGGAAALANMFAVGILDIHDYASSTKNKTVRSFSGFDSNGAGTVALDSNLWLNTNAITSITLSCSANFSTTSTFALYGIKGA
jgi:hypothetical protein